MKVEPVVKVSNQPKDLLNKAIAREIQVSIQYMWQHIQGIGVKGVAVQDKFQQTAIAEMKHAEKIAESNSLLMKPIPRVEYPVTRPIDASL